MGGRGGRVRGEEMGRSEGEDGRREVNANAAVATKAI